MKNMQKIPEEGQTIKYADLGTDQVSFTYSTSRKATGEYSLHCHNFYEVYLFMEGDADYLVEGKQYRPTPDSLLLLSPHCFHGVKVNSDMPYRRYSLHFHPDILSAERRSLLLSAFPSPDRRNAEIYFEQADRLGLVGCFEALADCTQKPEPLRDRLLPIFIEALLARILSISRDASAAASDRDADTVSDILLYLNRHVGEPVTLDQLSDRFYISKHHLNKVFRRATGTTVFDYLLHKRIVLAQELLIDGLSAQEAAARTGFGDYSSFYRSYRRILGHSPLQDRGVLPSLRAGTQKKLEHVSFGG